MTFEVNIHAMFYLAKAAVPHMPPGGAIINTASVNSDIADVLIAYLDEKEDAREIAALIEKEGRKGVPNSMLLAYATTKGAIQTGGLPQMLAEKGIRVNAAAPGPIWTPLIPSTMPDDAVTNFGKQVR